MPVQLEVAILAADAGGAAPVCRLQAEPSSEGALAKQSWIESS